MVPSRRISWRCLSGEGRYFCLFTVTVPAGFGDRRVTWTSGNEIGSFRFRVTPACRDTG